MSNAQSDGRRNIKRIEFRVGNKYYKFMFNPEEYMQEEPNRAHVTQTKSGGWVDAFGPGVGMLSMKGTTGFKGTTKDPTKGFKKFKELRKLFRDYMKKASNGRNMNSHEFIVYNYTDGDYWVVVPESFRLFRSIARPLLYMYEINLILLHPVASANRLTGRGTDLRSSTAKLS